MTGKFFYAIAAILMLPVFSMAASEEFVEVAVHESFREFLLNDPDLMGTEEAFLVTDEAGRTALIGIGKVVVEEFRPEKMPQIRRKGEMRARKTILDLTGDVEVRTARGSKEQAVSGPSHPKMSLSTFFQATEKRVAAKIQRIPVIGTWWSPRKTVFYLAVGKIMGDEPKETGIHLSDPGKDLADFQLIDGEEPFISILKACPELRKNGGVRGFVIDGKRKVILSVASATIKGSPVKARKIARLKAIRTLIEKKEGVRISSLESLVDIEQLALSEMEENVIQLSKFFAVQEERVKGKIQSMPVVASWTDEGNRVLYLGLGEVFWGQGAGFRVQKKQRWQTVANKKTEGLGVNEGGQGKRI